MPSTTTGRFKLYPKEDPRMAFYPTQSVAGALPSMATQTFTFTSPRARLFAVASGRSGLDGGSGRTHGSAVTTSSSGSSTSAAAAAAAAAHVAAVVQRDEECPPYTVHVGAAGVFGAGGRAYAADVLDEYGLKVLAVKGKSGGGRRPARYEIFDQTNVCSTKGMPKKLPVFTLQDTAHASAALVDATLCKQGRPMLRLRVDKPIGADGDSVWTGRDPDTDAEVLVITDFISQPGVPPSVTVRACPPFSIDLPLTSCLWAVLWDLYSRKVGGRRSR